MTQPTIEQFTSLQQLYDHFNRSLFNNKLNNCICNLSREVKKCNGFFSPNRWQKDKTKVHEITLNPYQLHRDNMAICSTLVHEMVHLWQEDFGKPTSKYHNKEWGSKMKEIGLYPSNTGKPGGKETGQQMTHYIMEKGKFILSYDIIKNKINIPYKSIPVSLKEKKKKNASKTKYTCPECETNAWAKPDTNIVCGDCKQRMTPQD